MGLERPGMFLCSQNAEWSSSDWSRSTNTSVEFVIILETSVRSYANVLHKHIKR